MEVKIILGRRILNEILTTYLPTIIICVVSFSTNYFKAFFFEAIVTVNLTSLLVLTTLFISVSDSLPKTSYVKMIDIWLITVLCVPFFEVLLHTVIDAMREDDKKPGEVPGPAMDSARNPDVHIGSKVVPLPSVGAMTPDGRRAPSLIARNEKDEVEARRAYYKRAMSKAAKNANILRALKLLLRRGLPTVFVLFIAVYGTAGVLFNME